MIIKGKKEDYLVIPVADLVSEMNRLKKEILRHEFDNSNVIRVRNGAKIEFIEEIIKYYE